MSGQEWLRRFFSEEPLIGVQDLAALRKSIGARDQVASCDFELLAIVNKEIETTTLALMAWVSTSDQVRYKHQQDFKSALAVYMAKIDALPEPLRSEAVLPAEYIERMLSGAMFNYANKRESGAPEKWKRDAFYLNLLLIYTLITGKSVGKTEQGPAFRCVRDIIALLHRKFRLKGGNDTDARLIVAEIWDVEPSGSVVMGIIKKNGWSAGVNLHIEKVVKRHTLVDPRWQRFVRLRDNGGEKGSCRGRGFIPHQSPQ